MMNKAFHFGWLEQEVAEISSVACFVGALLMIAIFLQKFSAVVSRPMGLKVSQNIVFVFPSSSE